MIYVLVGLGVLVALFVLAFAALLVNRHLASRRQCRYVERKLEPVIAPLRAGAAPDPSAIAALAADAEFRNDLFDALQELGQAALFPPQYRTVEAFAESVVVSWLAHPNELQKAPDVLELVGKHFVESGTALGKVGYFLYRFRVEPPHFAADKGWLAAYCGPFLVSPGAPLVAPLGLFSEMQSFDQMKPEEYVHEVHEAARRNGSVEALEKAVRDSRPDERRALRPPG
jgi:hypothetical protein